MTLDQKQQGRSLDYRPDIDGLRAIAVLAVVVYHAKFDTPGWPVLEGGYLGVDVFLVLSGYLIASIVFGELQRDTFSFRIFYERRVRRILPALLVVLIASSALAWKFMLPEDLVGFSESIFSTFAFSSNVYFWLEDPYTADPSLLKPLLHTWSLAVEEQFYIIFPGIVFFLWRFADRYLLVAFISISIISLVSASYLIEYAPDTVFYLLPFRAWELLAGAILAKLQLHQGRNPKGILTQLLPFIGLLAIIFSFITFNEATPHPSWPTLIPVVGTMLVIWYSMPGGVVSRILSSPPFVGIGLISYSLYLWHYPLFAFTRIARPDASESAYLQLAILAIGLSILTYSLIEQPFRKKQVITTKMLAGVLSVTLCALAIPNALFILNDGYPARLGPIVNLFNNLAAHPPPDSLDCIDDEGNITCDSLLDSRINVVAVGDSHAEAISDRDTGIPALARHRSLNFTGLYHEGCPMISGTYLWYRGHKQDECLMFSARVDRFLSKAPPLKIIYSARLPVYFDGSQFDNGEGGVDRRYTFHLTGEDKPEPDPRAVSNAITRTLTSWLEYGHKLIIIYPVPETGWDIPKYVKSHLNQYDANQKLEAYTSLNLTTDYSVVRERNFLAYQALDNIGEHSNLKRIYPEKFLCSPTIERCKTHDANGLLYSDADHLSRYGTTYVLAKIKDYLSSP